MQKIIVCRIGQLQKKQNKTFAGNKLKIRALLVLVKMPPVLQELGDVTDVRACLSLNLAFQWK